MDLPLDILRSIILLLRINDIENLCLVDKTFNNLCNEKSLWLEKFKEKDLTIINDNINTFSQYLDEYKKVSYATYTTDCLLNINVNDTNDWFYNQIIRFEPNFLFDDLKNILDKSHPILMMEQDNTKKYANIEIEIGTKRSIRYRSCEKDINYFVQNNRVFYHYNPLLSIEYYDDENFIISLINKTLYHYPSIVIKDNNYPLVTKDTILNPEIIYDIHDKLIIGRRQKYWDECYSKYEELYF